jgi:glycosyltransferase involved in cell wall biosynthesis
MRILLLPRYTEAGASSRYRSYMYVQYLREQGHDVTVEPLLSDDYIERLYAERSKSVADIGRSFLHRAKLLIDTSGYDLIFLESEAFPWLPYWFESLLLASRIPYVVDYDDAIFHRYDRHPSGFVRGILGAKIDKIMHRAALVVAGNDYLADRARRAGARRVEIIPTVVDTRQYRCSAPNQEDIFTVGWVGSLTTARYLGQVEGVLQKFCSNGKARLVTVGIRRLRLTDVAMEVIQPWSEEEEVRQLQRFDVGIMPLEDSPWERGKCGHKLIKYMAACRPVIASPVGVNVDIVDHGKTGFLVSSPEEWVDALTTLRGDASLGERLGQAGRRKVEAHYSLEICAPRLVAALESVVV